MLVSNARALGDTRYHLEAYALGGRLGGGADVDIDKMAHRNPLARGTARRRPQPRCGQPEDQASNRRFFVGPLTISARTA